MPKFLTELKKAFTFDYEDRGWNLNKIKAGLLGLALVAAIAGAVVASVVFGFAPLLVAAVATGGFLGFNAIMHTGSMIYNRVKHGSIVPTKDHGVEENQSSRLATAVLGYVPLAPLFSAYDFRGNNIHAANKVEEQQGTTEAQENIKEKETFKQVVTEAAETAEIKMENSNRTTLEEEKTKSETEVSI